MSKPTCPKCGGEILCRYFGETGDVRGDYRFSWEHLCLNPEPECDYKELFYIRIEIEASEEEILRKAAVCPASGCNSPGEKKMICPKCGSEVRCSYLGDRGGVDYYFTWEHYCTNPTCDYREGFGEYVGIGQEYEGMGDRCPICSARSHRPRR